MLYKVDRLILIGISAEVGIPVVGTEILVIRVLIKIEVFKVVQADRVELVDFLNKELLPSTPITQVSVVRVVRVNAKIKTIYLDCINGVKMFMIKSWKINFYFLSCPKSVIFLKVFLIVHDGLLTILTVSDNITFDPTYVASITNSRIRSFFHLSFLLCRSFHY